MPLHARQNSFNPSIRPSYQTRSRALSASPSPPPIPPQPNHFQFNEQQQERIVTYETPEPPPRRYNLVPIRDVSNQSQMVPSPNLNVQKQNSLSSFGRPSYNRHNDYENTRELIRPPVVVKDPRRKPYYYNELNQHLDANDNNVEIPSTELALLKADLSQVNDGTLALRSSSITLGSSSGGSLDNII